MPTPLYTPRVNNNDDTVCLVKLLVKPGEVVPPGQLVAEVETDNPNFNVESDRDGYLLAVEKTLRRSGGGCKDEISRDPDRGESGSARSRRRRMHYVHTLRTWLH